MANVVTQTGTGGSACVRSGRAALRVALAIRALVVLIAVGSVAYGQAPEAPSDSARVEWVTREVRALRVTYHTFESASAKVRVSYHLYTPEVYQREPERRFPVVYWLHGSGGGLGGIAPLSRAVDEAITSGRAPAFLVVFVNGLTQGMYVDWKNGRVPLERVIVDDLVAHVDATHRTRAERGGRLLEGFSMGGYGAARLGFKYSERFGGVSMLGAGPLQAELIQTPRAGPQHAAEVLERVYGGDQAYFREVSPRRLAEQNVEAIRRGLSVRIVIGDRDETFPANRAFHEHLRGLGIEHEWAVLPGVGHDTLGVLGAMGERFWEFHRKVFGAPVPTEAPAPSRTERLSLRVGERERWALVHYPRGHRADRATPVVVAFHGGGGHPESMVRFSGLSEKADEAGFIVVYPAGTGRLNDRLLTFNAGNCCGYAMEQNVDDVGFVRALLDRLGEITKVDPLRVYATGMSNGAMMAYRVASELADRFAAIAPVGGPMGLERCEPSRPVAVMHIHGTEDRQAPFDGGQGVGNPLTPARPNFQSVDHSLQQWIRANGCDSEPKVTEMPDVADDGMTVTKKTWGGGRVGAEVVLIRVNGGGHTWPGISPPLATLGASTRDVSANDLMWAFFEKHARKPASAAEGEGVTPRAPR